MAALLNGIGQLHVFCPNAVQMDHMYESENVVESVLASLNATDGARPGGTHY